MTSTTEPVLTLLDPLQVEFPDTSRALADPDGLLAVGGDLTPEWLLAAYRRGIFPWFSDDQPVLWWSPDPRCVVIPTELPVSRSLRKRIRRGTYSVTCDRAFEAVIDACAAPRADGPGTWITDEMREAYITMHALGFAHSVEVWQDDVLVGGLYGLAIGRVFFGESMFHRATDASKVAFVHLVRQLADWGCELVDCQVSNPHLLSLGAIEISRSEFERRLAAGVEMPALDNPWPEVLEYSV
ncbi:leucyl/phenylalanyl-tRNA--protein transferase [Microbulbifer celer]|uniref:Leucyl/phenylalanyl-tRNA--protein transferase n=1 Tax=Microbulbifer celer TaxID=435905 RepID=A0ABW3UA17_9GAMM|nr:leucyl/phenylalanyl-tRNA--protein transferase [Microbulbifer celer]UFN58801.1 leucyl/phenylalanyl-tRNA--protein transferase [Microbulbifer celer]